MEQTLTPKQDEAATMAKAIAKQEGAIAIGIIGGYAGTGKTTTLQAITEEMDTVLLAPTGKAAVRISQVTGMMASTIHKWMYDFDIDPKSGKPRFYRKELEKIQVPRDRLVVVDEASMLSREVFQDVLDVCRIINCNLLLVGDAFQLPPISLDKNDKFSVFNEDFGYTAKVMLTDILRQAADNPIIQISDAIRHGRIAEAMDLIDTVSDRDELDGYMQETVQSNGMVICHTNKTRHYLNKYYRQLAGLGSDLEVGEPLLVLKNNYALNIFNGETFIYGGQGDVIGTKPDVYCPVSNSKKDIYYFKTKLNGQDVILAREAIEGQLEGFSQAAIERAIDYYMNRGDTYLHCNYGYTLSCHKAQGHQAEKVLVFMERSVNPFSKDGRRWLYTAVTRAESEVALVSVNRIDELLPLTAS